MAISKEIGMNKIRVVFPELGEIKQIKNASVSDQMVNFDHVIGTEGIGDYFVEYEDTYGETRQISECEARSIINCGLICCKEAKMATERKELVEKFEMFLESKDVESRLDILSDIEVILGRVIGEFKAEELLDKRFDELTNSSMNATEIVRELLGPTGEELYEARMDEVNGDGWRDSVSYDQIARAFQTMDKAEALRILDLLNEEFAND